MGLETILFKLLLLNTHGMRRNITGAQWKGLTLRLHEILKASFAGYGPFLKRNIADMEATERKKGH